MSGNGYSGTPDPGGSPTAGLGRGREVITPTQQNVQIPRACWKDNLSPMSNAKVGGTNPPIWAAYKGNIYAYQFQNKITAQEQEVFVSFHINHDYALNTKLYPHVHCTTNDVSPSGNVRWGIEYIVALGHDQQAFGSATTVYVSGAITTQYQHYILEVSDNDAIDGEALGIEPDTVILMRIFRNSGDALDTFESDNMFGLFVDLHYLADHVGTKKKSPNFYISE
jgi:hypothetical protein